MGTGLASVASPNEDKLSRLQAPVKRDYDPRMYAH